MIGNHAPKKLVYLGTGSRARPLRDRNYRDGLGFGRTVRAPALRFLFLSGFGALPRAVAGGAPQLSLGSNQVGSIVLAATLDFSICLRKHSAAVRPIATVSRWTVAIGG